MLGIAYGRIGLAPQDFWDMSWYEFQCAMSGYNESLLHDWNVMRHHASIEAQLQTPKKDRAKVTPQKLVPLPNDPKPQPMSKEERDKWLAFFNRKVIDTKTYN